MLLSFLFTILTFSLSNSYVLEKQGLKSPPGPANLQRLASLRPQRKFPDIHEKLDSYKQTSGCSNVNHNFTSAGQVNIFTSPGWFGNYPRNADCSWFFTSPPGTTMSITCEMNISCKNGDYLYISTNGDGTAKEQYCGLSFSGPIESVGNHLSVGFRSTSSTLWGFGYNFKCYVISKTASTSTTTTTPSSTTTSTTSSSTTSSTTTSGSTTTSSSTTISTTTQSSNTTALNCSCGVLNPNGAARIVGGTETNRGEIPWRVFVFIYNPATGSGNVCGGTVISNEWIMTAAHCTMNFVPGTHKIAVWTEAQENPLRVDNGAMFEMDYFEQHPAFDRNTFDNDISLLHLTTSITYQSNVSPACLPFNMIGNEHDGDSVLASGWGTTQPVPVGQENNDPTSDTLLEVTLPVLTTEQCRQYLPEITDNMFCTYLPPKDTCQGDSGGSIDYQNTDSFYYAIGIVSWGYGCAQTDNPGVYTKVTNYLTWIETTTGADYCKNP